MNTNRHESVACLHRLPNHRRLAGQPHRSSVTRTQTSSTYTSASFRRFPKLNQLPLAVLAGSEMYEFECDRVRFPGLPMEAEDDALRCLVLRSTTPRDAVSGFFETEARLKPTAPNMTMAVLIPFREL
jgi:hypothetical protein